MNDNQSKLENILFKIIDSGNMIQLEYEKKAAIGKVDNEFVEYAFDAEKTTVRKVLSRESVEETVKAYTMKVEQDELENELTFWETLEEIYSGIEIA